MFTKADVPGWFILIPILNLAKIFELVYTDAWKILLLLVPILNVIIIIAFWFRLAQSYGKGIGFGFGLLFLNPIFLLILALDSNATYQGPATSGII